MAKEKNGEILAPATRTSAGLRDALFDELDRLRNGTTNASNANAVAKLADQIINTVKMEMEVQRHAQRVPAATPTPNVLGTPLSLGS